MKKHILSLLSIFIFTCIANAQLTDWQYKKAINVTERSGNDLTNYQVLLHINTAALIQANQLNADASDLRFATDCEGINVIPHYIEKDTNSTNAFVWVLMDLEANSDTPIFMFYGNPTATSNAVFEEVFINNFILEVGAELILAGNTELDFDWFEIKAGAIYTLAPNHEGLLKINARRIIIDGDVIGDSLGYKGVIMGDGGGPGGGKVGDNGGGGGYGGKGGDGENVAVAGPGIGGQPYGTESGIDIDAGSAGSGGNSLAIVPGGNGGAGFYFNGVYTTVSGNISCNGGRAINSQTYVAGPGSGGGILLIGDVVEFNGNASANGAHGEISQSTGWGGGGGAGGRIKMFYESDFTNTGNLSVTPGFTLSGNAENGEPGTTFSTGDSTLFFPKASTPTDIETNVVLASLSGTNEVCQGDSLTITATVGFTGYDFLLNGNSIINTTNNQITIGGLADGDKLSVIASSFGCTTTSNELEISTTPAITADFSSNGAGTTFSFTNNSSNGTDYFWEFGDGATSNQENPTHQYAIIDTFTVCLTTSNTNGCPPANFCTDIITTCTNPIANQYLTATGLQLTGTDSSLNSTSRTWYVDNQIVSVDSVLSYSFATAGNYDVCLASNNFCGQDSTCTTITVCELSSSYFTSSVSGSTVSFTDSSSNTISWEWDFGNGTTFSGATPNNVVYPDSNATYTVCLTTTNECDEENVYCDNITITSTTSVSEIYLHDVGLYPNPANNHINISGITNQANYVIYNIAGRIMKQGNLRNGQTTITTNELVAGTYFIQFQFEKEIIVKPIAIMH